MTENNPPELPAFLRENEARIAACSMGPGGENDAIKVNHWQKFADDEAYAELMQELRGSDEEKQIYRTDIFALADKIRECRGDDAACNHQLKKVFLATMMWGYGKKGIGWWRTEQMVQTPHFADTVRGAYDNIAENDVWSAYTLLANTDTKLVWCNRSFFTKYLYFIGRKCSPQPLILDDVVEKRLSGRCGLDAKRYKAPYTRRYFNYIEDMQRWAKQLGVAPEQIEYFLYHSPAG